MKKQRVLFFFFLDVASVDSGQFAHQLAKKRKETAITVQLRRAGGNEEEKQRGSDEDGHRVKTLEFFCCVYHGSRFLMQ